MKALLLVLYAALAGLPTSPVFAASTARSHSNLPIFNGPGSNYDRIGTLPANARVPIETCTVGGRWCLILNAAGPDGWVRGAYLVGSPAKVNALPYVFPSYPDFRYLP